MNPKTKDLHGMLHVSNWMLFSWSTGYWFRLVWRGGSNPKLEAVLIIKIAIGSYNYYIAMVETQT